jgi:uncharacterized delta-60 repeat protein/uncharacterized repeat protein (TIGR01451 family)
MKSRVRRAVGSDTIKSQGTKRNSVPSTFIAGALSILVFFSMLLHAPGSIVPGRVLADPGDPVGVWSVDGVVETDFAGGNDSAFAITATRFGNIIAAGSATIPGKGTDFALACYDENGNLDPAFGEGGKATVDFFGANDGARGVVVQPDQKMVLSGFATNGSERQFAIARFNADGSLDTTFDQDGKVVLDLGSTSEAFKVALQEGGKIVAVGDSRPRTSLDFTIVRLNQDGSPDNSFGNNGVVRVDFGFADRAIDLAIDEENIFVCGFVVKSQTDSDMGIARLNITNGGLNNAFDGDGKFTADYSGGRDGAQSIKIRGAIPPLVDRSYLLVGGFATPQSSAAPDNWVFALSYGAHIESLYNQGREITDYNNGIDQIFRLIDQPDGDIVGIGWAGDGANFDLGITKWDRNGQLDSSWGLQGKYTFDTASGGNNVSFDGMLYEDTIITAGTGLNPATRNDDFILTRHENEKFAKLTKRAPDAPVVKGDIITYTFEIENLTNNELSLVVTDRLPDSISFDESLNPDWRDLFPGSELLGNIPERRISVPGGQTVIIGLRARASQSGILKNKANLLLPHPDDPLFGYVTPTFLGSSEVESEVTEPSITGAVIQGKKLLLFGSYGNSSDTNLSGEIEASAIEPQASCPVILIDGKEQKTKRDSDNPSTTLIAKKGGKKIGRGQTVRIRVRLCSGIETDDFIFTRPL